MKFLAFAAVIFIPVTARTATAQDHLPGQLNPGYTNEVDYTPNGGFGPCIGVLTAGSMEFRRNGESGPAVLNFEQPGLDVSRGYPGGSITMSSTPSASTPAENGYSGPASLVFKDAADGTITFDYMISGTSMTNSFPFTNYTQTYAASTGLVSVSFGIVYTPVANCIVPFQANFRVRG